MIGEQVRAAREARGWSQEELGRLVGVSAAQISRIESGARGASLEVARALTSALRLDPASVLGVESDNAPPADEDAAA